MTATPSVNATDTLAAHFRKINDRLASLERASSGGGGPGSDEVFIGPNTPTTPGLELWYDTDAVAPASSAWTSYVPVVTASVTNPNLGSAGQGASTGYWTQRGTTIFWRVYMSAGGTGISAGSGNYSVSLPPPVPLPGQIVGQGWIYGATGFVCLIADNSPARLMRTDTGVQLASGAGFTVAGHVLGLQGFYEVA